MIDKRNLIEKISEAIESAEIGHSLSLTRLIDGESTYTLEYDDGGGPLEFSDIHDGYEHIRQRKRKAQAEAVIDVMNLDLLATLEDIEQQARRHKHSTAESDGTHIALENIENLARLAIASAKAGA